MSDRRQSAGLAGALHYRPRRVRERLAGVQPERSRRDPDHQDLADEDSGCVTGSAWIHGPSCPQTCLVQRQSEKERSGPPESRVAGRGRPRTVSGVDPCAPQSCHGPECSPHKVDVGLLCTVKVSTSSRPGQGLHGKDERRQGRDCAHQSCATVPSAFFLGVSPTWVSTAFLLNSTVRSRSFSLTCQVAQ